MEEEITQEQILQQWIEDFEDLHNKKPSKETILDWEIQISIMHSEDQWLD